MIVSVPFQYRVEGLREGRQRNGTHDVWELAELDIRVVSSEDAPIAVSWEDRLPDMLRIDPHAPGDWGCHSVDGSAHTVFYENSHWVALNADQNMWAAEPGPYAAFTFDDLVRRIERSGDCPVMDTAGYYDGKARKQVEACRNDGHYMFSDIKSSTRDHRLRGLNKKASSLIMVGDRLYRKCLEPRLWLMKATVHADRTTAGQSHDVALVRVTIGHEHEQHHRRVDMHGRKTLGLNECDLAISLAAEFNRWRTHAAAADAVNQNRRVAVTHMLAFDEDAHLRDRVRQLHSRIVEQFLPIPIGQMAKSTLRCFVELDDAQLDLKTTEGLALFEEAALRMQKDLSNPHNNQHKLLPLADELVEVLDNRNIDLGETIEKTARNSVHGGTVRP
ncbi:hypothetical protein HFN89_04100 [Rhizobium laguerreae]|nr:hypothetical protein [Rhizobium laguerreae]